MLNNIGLPGILLLSFILILLYLLVKNFNKVSEAGEASRTKYITVWFLVGFTSNILNTLWSVVWNNSLPLTLLDPKSNLIGFIIFYLVALLGVYVSFVIIHSFFSTLVRKKIIPYIWLASMLGIVVELGQLAQIDIQSQYPDFFTYNAVAILVLQALYLTLILGWIKKNPGFVITGKSDRVTERVKQQPALKAKREVKEDVTDENNKAGKAPKIDSETYIASENKPLINPITGKDTERHATGSDIAQRQNLIKEGREVDQQDQAISLEANVTDEDLRQSLYAACKFGDVKEILSLLGNFDVRAQNDVPPFKLIDKNGVSIVFENDKDLIQFAKGLANG